MKKSLVLIAGIAAAIAFAGVCRAQIDPFMGTWKLNEAKSTFAPGVPRNDTVVYEAAGDKVKVTVDSTDTDGRSTHNEWTGNFDGKDYPVIGDSTSDACSYKKISDRMLQFTLKKSGKVTVIGRIVVSADGKSRIVTTSEAGAEAGSFKITRDRLVYNKQ